MNLDRARAEQFTDRQRLRTATEEAAGVILARLRSGTTAVVNGVTYSVEQVTWRLNDSRTEATADPHGVMGLLRDGQLLAVRSRKQSGLRIKQVPTPMARIPTVPDTELHWDVHPATDEERKRFAVEFSAVTDAFGSSIRAESSSMRDATEQLLRVLTELLSS